MRLPDPIANTTTEAYLAYKAGVLAEGDLKPKLYEPYIHLDAWLAYWTGLTQKHPVKNVGKNLLKIAGNWTITQGSGVTVTEGDDGSIILNGTVEARQDIRVYSSINRLEVDSGTVLTLSRNTRDYNLIWHRFTTERSGTTSDVVYMPVNGPYSYTYTTQSTDYGFQFLLRLPVGAVFDNEKIYLQLEKSSTATPFEPYTGEPEMLTDEEAYIAYLSGVTNTYPEEFRDPADIRVAAYLRYLISARFGRPEYPVTNEEFYLSMLKTKYIPSGDPSSDIVIDGTAKAPFVDVKMYGDTFQQSYTGKNLLGLPDSFVETGSNTTTTYSNGLTTISSSGTTRTYPHWCELDTSYPAGTYTFSISEALDYDIFIRLYQDSSTYPETFTIRAGSTEATRTTTYQIVKMVGLIALPLGSVYSKTFKAQVESGSSATTFEPYTGGQASPNPDYPQTVQTVTGENVVKICGKNLLASELSGTVSITGASIVFSGSSITVNRTTGAISYTRKTNTLQYAIANGQKLAFSMNYKSGTINANGTYQWRFGVYGIKVDGTSERFGDLYLPYNTTTPSASVILTATSDYVGFALGCYLSSATNTTTGDVVFDCQLELGSTATAYEPYSSNDYEINLGKNLFDKNNATISHFYPHTSEIRQNNSAVSIVLPVEVGTTYTVSTTNRSLIDSTPAVACTDHLVTSAPDSFLSRTSWGSGDSVSFTAPAGAKYMYIYVKWTTDATTIANVLATIQVEKGSQATTYAPYFTPIELCKLGTYQDYIYKDGDNWKVHKATSKATFSDLNWQDYQIGSTGHYRVYSSGITDSVLPPSANNVNFTGYCSIYTNKTSIRTYAREEGCSIQGDGYANAGTILIYDADYDYSGSATNWKTARGAGQIYFVLKTATDTTITDTTLIAQLEALVAGGAENGTTYIKVNATDPNLPGLLYVEAPKYE